VVTCTFRVLGRVCGTPIEEALKLPGSQPMVLTAPFLPLVEAPRPTFRVASSLAL
jgi:hypothetical protein